MNWKQLLSLKRMGDTQERLRKDQDDTRLGFDVDYDRIIFSKAFRSLQDKTQVIPLSETDFVHTRLTHSLEVSVVGRSLGRVAGKALLQKYPDLATMGYQSNDFGAIVAAASLMHDIGNPPFGHSGEKAIGEYFKTGKGGQYKQHLTKKQWQDLIDFEGNANGFHLVNETRKGVVGGLRLSYATLGAFMKYPKESLPYRESNHIAEKKYGVFQKDLDLFQDICASLGLEPIRNNKDGAFHRHPLAFLVEAADDICYTIIDFEDGINLGLIEEEYALEYLINLVRGNIQSDKYRALGTTSDRLSYLRALAINTLIQEAVEIFMENETAMLAGNFQEAILDKSKYKAQIKDIISLSVSKIYESKEVIAKEISGYKVINDLLDAYVCASFDSLNSAPSNYNNLLLKTLPSHLYHEDMAAYDRLLNICKYVAGFSDSYAWLQYKNLKALT